MLYRVDLSIKTDVIFSLETAYTFAGDFRILVAKLSLVSGLSVLSVYTSEPLVRFVHHIIIQVADNLHTNTNLSSKQRTDIDLINDFTVESAAAAFPTTGIEEVPP